MRIAHIAADGMEAIEECGARVPDAILVDPEFFKEEEMRTVAAVVEHTRLVLNPEVEYWRNPRRVVQKLRKGDLWSTAHPMHLFYHEAGHWELCRRYGQDYVVRMKTTPLTGETQAIARSISDYAVKNIGEFMCEVYARLCVGDPVSAEALALYKKYRGLMPVRK